MRMIVVAALVAAMAACGGGDNERSDWTQLQRDAYEVMATGFKGEAKDSGCAQAKIDGRNEESWSEGSSWVDVLTYEEWLEVTTEFCDW